MIIEALAGTISATIGTEDRLKSLTRLAVGGLGLAVLLAALGGFPVDIPMPTHAFGWVEPTCGLTRGSTAIARGDFALAWRYNPASLLVMALGVGGAVRVGIGRVTGRWLNVRTSLRPLGWVLVVLTVVVLEFHQQSNANFIINSRR